MIMALEADKRELQARLLKPVVPNQEKAVAASEDWLRIVWAMVC